MSDLTPRQRQILAFIQQCIADDGLPPTRAEIAGALGFRSANAAEEHLRALARKGVIELKAGASRGIVLTDVLREQLGLPIVGRVAAGRPILAEEHVEARYQLDPDLFKGRPARIEQLTQVQFLAIDPRSSAAAGSRRCIGVGHHVAFGPRHHMHQPAASDVTHRLEDR